MKRIQTGLLALLLSASAGRLSAQDIRISTISVTGNVSIEDSEVLDAIGLKSGAGRKAETTGLSSEIIASLYQSRGFMDARISVIELQDGSSVQLLIDVKEGVRYKFGTTSVTGLEKLRAGTVRKELAYRKGDSYSQEKLIASQSQLYATDWFESLRIRISSSAPPNTINIDSPVKSRYSCRENHAIL